MKTFKIRKRSGGFRTIYAPNREEKQKLQDILHSHLAKKQNNCDFAHAFRNDRNIVTNAEIHIGKLVSINLDLSNFFDTVTPAMLKGKVSKEILNETLCFPDGACRQGLPTSPALANIAFEPCDLAIIKMLKKADESTVYSRYADDLTISLDNDNKEKIDLIIKSVKAIVSRSGFKLNDKKTRVQHSKAGNREVCSVQVGESNLSVNRKTRRNIRASLHNSQKTNTPLTPQQVGLIEFAKLKTPNSVSSKGKAFQDAKNLAEARLLAFEFKLRQPSKVNKLIEDKDISENVKITNDPVYFYGMSYFTTGWRSCMRMGSGQYAKGITLLQQHPAISLAVNLSKEVMTVKGVTRNKMIQRTLLYRLEDGRTCFGRIYPNDETGTFSKILKEQGFIPCSEAVGADVKGNVRCIAQPYFDNAKTRKVNVKRDGKEYKAYKLTIK